MCGRAAALGTIGTVITRRAAGGPADAAGPGAGEIEPRILIDWFRRTARDLPWREPGTTGWQVLVSEIMLQQTPVVRVQPIWLDWMRRWPTPSALAGATPADTVRAWGKLGYPRRALRLHECAGLIARDHDDVVPDDVEVLLSLPGIGDYTARAVVCFAYGRRAPLVDTNVRRVVARAVHGEAVAVGATGKRHLAEVAAMLPARAERAAAFSAALMELGALVCTARSPACAACPLAARCRWLAAGRPGAGQPARPAQGYAGTDRQVRGRLLDVVRGSTTPVPKALLDAAWTTDPGQRERALLSLLEDGLLGQDGAGRFTLAGG